MVAFSYSWALLLLATTEAFTSTSTSIFNRKSQLFSAHTQNNDENREHIQIVETETEQPADVTVPTRRNFLSNMAAISTALATATVPFTPGAGAIDATATATPTAIAIASPPFNKDLTWPLGKIAFSLLPLAGTSTRRATVQECIVPDTIWTMDQIQGVVNVNVPIRQTVVRLSEAAGGGLLIYNPVAPTPQLLKMVKELEEKYGPVRHLVLGTVALEHKATFGAFAELHPKATVWLQPGQWSFPLPVSVEFLGVTQRGPRLREIPNSRADNDNVPVPVSVSRQYSYYAKKDPVPEWAADFEWETLGPLKFKSVGAFSETALFHKQTKSLVLTDTVVSITDTPPKIIEEDPRAMLFHARDSITDIIEDTPENRRKGWRRMVQFGLVFFPSQIDVVPTIKAISQASKIDESMKPLGEGAVPGSLYPWTWHDNDADLNNFRTISQNGKIFCPPILTKLILDREPQATLEWAERVASRFDFERIIPGHLNNDVKATPNDFRQAFEVLANNPDSGGTGTIKGQRPLSEDLALLQKASDILTTLNVVAPSKVCDGEEARAVGRFASAAAAAAGSNTDQKYSVLF